MSLFLLFSLLLASNVLVQITLCVMRSIFSFCYVCFDLSPIFSSPRVDVFNVFSNQTHTVHCQTGTICFVMCVWLKCIKKPFILCVSCSCIFIFHKIEIQINDLLFNFGFTQFFAHLALFMHKNDFFSLSPPVRCVD